MTSSSDLLAIREIELAISRNQKVIDTLLIVKHDSVCSVFSNAIDAYISKLLSIIDDQSKQHALLSGISSGDL